MAGAEIGAWVAVGLGAVGVLASVVALVRGPAERPLATGRALLGAAGLLVTATLCVLLPPISFRPVALACLIGGGALVGLVGGGVVGVRRDSQGVLVRGGTWHVLPAALALLSLQLTSLAGWLDGVVFATAAIVAFTALAVGAALVVAARGAAARRGTAPAPQETHRWRHQRAVVGLAIGGAIVLATVGALMLRDRGGDVPVPGPTAAAAASPAPDGSVTEPPAATASPDPTASIAPEPTDPAPVEEYVGLTFPNGEPPAGITEFGGALIAGTGHATSWMAGPEGDMFWLLREAGATADGSISRWEVRDVVIWPPVTEDSAQVVTGAVRCEVDGAPVQGVVAVFPLVDEEWFVDPYFAWRADTTSGRFAPLPASTRCQNEAYGV